MNLACFNKLKQKKRALAKKNSKTGLIRITVALPERLPPAPFGIAYIGLAKAAKEVVENVF
jgi:hypothetical protein